MATGYTYGVGQGDIVELREFALKCARGMGANIMMRDDPLDAPIREYQPSSYYRERVESARIALYDAERMTLDEAERRARAAYSRALDEHLKYEASKKATIDRYRAMLAKVEAWQPPTKEHEGLKTFMQSQLVESIEWEGGRSSAPEQQTGTAYRAALIDHARRNIEHLTREQAEEERRIAGCNAWNRALVESLK